MSEENFEPYLRQIRETIKESVNDKKLEEELKNHVTTYGMGIDAAVRFVIRKHSAPSNFSTTGTKKKISDLTCSENSVNVIGKIISAKPRDIIVRGSSKTIVEGSIVDETGGIGFTIWDGVPNIEVGKVYEFRNCYTKKFRNKPQINIGKNGSFAKIDGVDIDVSSDSCLVPEIKIKDITENLDNVTVTGNIRSVGKRVVTARGKEKTIFYGVLADDTGNIQYSAWKDFSLKENETIRVKNAYVNSWKGILRLNLGDNCEINREDAQFKDFKFVETRDKTIAEVLKTGGADITIRGTIVQIKQGSGLIQRCPICKRATRENKCSIHNSITLGPEDFDLRLKLIIDDETGAINANVNRGSTEKITGLTLNTAKKQIKDGLQESDITKKISHEILYKKVKATGSIVSDDYGSTIIVKDIAFENTDINSDAKHLLKIVEDYQ